MHISSEFRANHQIEQQPLNTVTVPAHDIPMFDTRVVGEDRYTSIDTRHLRNSDSYGSQVTAKYPVRNADGSLRMQHIPEQQITGHGKPLVNMNQRAIQEPSDIRHNTSVDTSGKVDVHTTTSVSYKTIGYYQEPSVKWETGVSTFGQVMAYGALGATAPRGGAVPGSGLAARG